MNDYSIQYKPKIICFKLVVGPKVHLGPGLDTGLVASYKVRPTISVFYKPKAQLTINNCKVYKYMGLDFRRFWRSKYIDFT